MSAHSLIKKLHIDKLNDMQDAAITAARAHDVILLSPTGSGKTLAFLLPVFERLRADGPGIQALILVPSRELALQIEDVWKQMGTGYKVNCCYGGHATRIEKNNLSQAPALLIGTPGRIAYHLRRGHIETETLHTLVLDEFDKSLELGFLDEMASIVSQLPNVNRRILTSATNLSDIPGFVGLSGGAQRISYLDEVAHQPTVRLYALLTNPADKHEALYSLLCQLGNQSTIVFCNHREAVSKISEMLTSNGMSHGVYHGGLEQQDREKALLKFRNGTYERLISTDLASRGLDIPEVACIVHYQLPNEEAFIHRNGRTARMQADGAVYILVHQETLPAFIDQEPTWITLPEADMLPRPSPWCTVYIAAGRKDKINKVDIVGLLLQKGKLQKEDLGRIEVFDHAAFAAVKRAKVRQMLTSVQQEKIKNKKIMIAISEN